jgi:NAD(P)-dependent dehydrogenase (short-subunit alcohol dehydrogenase family)
MQVTGKVVVVTGGANGIGKALCEAFHGAGAAKVVVTDIDGAGARGCGRRQGRGLPVRRRQGKGHPARH